MVVSWRAAVWWLLASLGRLTFAEKNNNISRLRAWEGGEGSVTISPRSAPEIAYMSEWTRVLSVFINFLEPALLCAFIQVHVLRCVGFILVVITHQSNFRVHRWERASISSSDPWDLHYNDYPIEICDLCLFSLNTHSWVPLVQRGACRGRWARTAPTSSCRPLRRRRPLPPEPLSQRETTI